MHGKYTTYIHWASGNGKSALLVACPTNMRTSYGSLPTKNDWNTSLLKHLARSVRHCVVLNQPRKKRLKLICSSSTLGLFCLRMGIKNVWPMWPPKMYIFAAQPAAKTFWRLLHVQCMFATVTSPSDKAVIDDLRLHSRQVTFEKCLSACS